MARTIFLGFKWVPRLKAWRFVSPYTDREWAGRELGVESPSDLQRCEGVAVGLPGFSGWMDGMEHPDNATRFVAEILVPE